MPRRTQPQTFEGPWEPGLKNALSGLLVMGPAFSVPTPGGGALFAKYTESEADTVDANDPPPSRAVFPCNTDADCQTPNTPSDTCIPFFDPPGVCLIDGSCEGENADLCFLRRPGSTLSVSTSAATPQDWLRATTEQADGRGHRAARD